MVAGTVITLNNDETINANTDDTVRIQSNDSDVILEVYSPNTSDGDASLELAGDAKTDATDRWRIVNDTGLGSLGLKCHQSVAGTFATLFVVAGADGGVDTGGGVVPLIVEVDVQLDGLPAIDDAIAVASALAIVVVVNRVR